MNSALSILADLIHHQSQQERAVFQCPSATQLSQQLDLSIPEQGQSLHHLQPLLASYLDLNPDVASAHFNKQLYSGQDEAAVLGDWLATLSNANMHTYGVSPVATLMEIELIKTFNTYIGFDEGDGLMVSGGSQANLIAMMLARHQAIPDLKQKGSQQTLVAYVSDQAHYSLQKAANVLGIGTNNVIAIESDQNGCMQTEKLEQAIEHSIQQGHTPFFVCCTAGTTVLGAYDPVEACSSISKQYGLWFHIDGAWGAPVLFSETHKHLLPKSHLADSFTWDAHKLMGVPLTAGFILVKEKGHLEAACGGGGSDYLFHTDDNASYNLGQKSIQCGRRADALKVWLSWQVHGHQGFANKVDLLQQLKTNFLTLIDEHPNFRLVAPASYLNVLFQYQPNTPISTEQTRKLMIYISQQLVQQGGAYVDYASFKGETGLRLIIANELMNTQQLKQLLDNCMRLAQSYLNP